MWKDTAPGAGEAGEAARIENKIFSKRNFLTIFLTSSTFKTKEIIEPKISLPSFEKKKIDAC